MLKACETICVAGCCGLGAFDFSPIHIASYLIRHSGEVRDTDVREIRAAITEWRQACGTPSGKGYISDAGEMNAILSPQDVDELCSLFERNIEAAIEIARRVQLQILPHVPDGLFDGKV
jgi:hypothetical protein